MKRSAKDKVPAGGDTAQLEALIRRLATRVPGYPYELALASRLSSQLEKRTAEAANNGLRPLNLSYVLYQSMMIIFGGEGGSIFPSEIALLTGERPNNVTHICNELEARELITRTPESDDRRRVKVALTAAGRRLLEKAQPLVWETWRLRYDGFTPAELKLLPLLLRRQIENVDRSLAESP